ncbi:MAG: hypothetical protein L0312_08090, partial [Acidobacteria bacterium]|nr:hypothetical protein [Acidobacteriota bacterium]
MRHELRARALISALASFFFSLFLYSCHTCRSEFTLDSLNFTRHDGNPILAPRGESWEAKDVFNPAAIVKDGKVYLLYRAEDRTGIGKWNGTSRLGLAVSDDGLHFQREPEPVLVPTEEYEKPGGCEDPRIVEHDGSYYVTYTAYDGKQARLCLASSKDLRRWTKHG